MGVKKEKLRNNPPRHGDRVYWGYWTNTQEEVESPCSVGRLTVTPPEIQTSTKNSLLGSLESAD